ncbi:hypothetical protein [Corynebacterium glyciniphilum]|uniref:hypothetical protein n=1 Tax=Corynebacterium glyciniphilum TaxID=1404244 RepID=UPI002353A59A
MRTLRRVSLRRALLPTLMTTLLTGSVLTACSSDDDASPEAPVDAPVSGVSVTVDDTGDAPREPLVWFSDPGEKETVFRATQGWGQTTEGDDDEEGEDDLPYDDVTMEVPVSASSSTDGNELEATVVAGRPTGDNTDGNDDLATAEGFTMNQKYNQDGRVTSRGFSAPEGASDAARSNVERSFTQMTDIPVVFPADDLGVGARWTVTGQVDDQMLGVSMRQGVTYTLLSREGSRIELDVDVERTPSVQRMSGSDLTVTDSSSESNGNITVDLRRPVPVSGMIETTTSVTYGETDSAVTVVQTSRTRSSWEPA